MLKHIRISFPRGDGDSFVVRNISGKHDERKIVVSLLESDELTAGLLWQKKNTLAGGSNAEVVVTYDENRQTSDFEITLLRDDTEALAESKYFLSVSSTAVDDIEDHETLVTADFLLRPSGENPLSGLPDADEISRWLLLDTANFADGVLRFLPGVGWVNIGWDEASDLILGSGFLPEFDIYNPGANFTPYEGVPEPALFEVDENGDLMLAEV